jgi:HlyD family secretion protein
MNKLRSFLYLATLLIVLLQCKGKQESIRPTVESISESVYASGIVKSRDQYQVFPTVSGLVQSILVSEGDLVKHGDPILKITNETSRLNVENSMLAADYAEVKANQDKLRELKVSIELAKSKITNDSLLFVRQRNLWDQKVGSRVEYEQRELAYKNSVTAYQTAIYRYNELKKQIDFTARQSRKNLEISASLANEFTISSQIDGKVYSILIEKGERVNPQSPVAVIGNAEQFELELQVDEYDIARIRRDQKIVLTMDSYKGQVFEARVEKIIPIMNEKSKSFRVEAHFAVQPQSLYPNLSVEANIIIQTKENVLTVPRNYLIGDSVAILENNERRKVTIGLRDYRKAEVLGGLSATDVLLKPAQ